MRGNTPGRVVFGANVFVNGLFEQKREDFGPKRESGALKLCGAEWGDLRTSRVLRTGVEWLGIRVTERM